MLVEEELARFSPERDTLLTVGNFDGVHLGHKHLISKLLEAAERQGLLSGAVTFRQHPEELLSPRSKPLFLTDIEERINLLEKEGLDIIILLSFTAELAQLSARQFVGLLQKHLRMRGLVVGPDFALGRGREGNADTLRQLGEAIGFSVTVVPPLMINGEVVSSTAVREALAAGDMNKVHELAGHPFSLKGKVVGGTGRGKELGFPTANLDTDSGQTLPPEGVYAGWAHIDGQAYQSMTNIGRRPTFGDHERTIEAYIVDYQGDLYHRELKVDLIMRLREEKKFDSVDALKQQMAEDVRRGSAILDAMGGK